MNYRSIIFFIIFFAFHLNAEANNNLLDTDDNKLSEDYPLYIEKTEKSYATLVYESSKEIILNIEKDNKRALFVGNDQSFSWKVKVSSEKLNYRIGELDAFKSDKKIPVGFGLELNVDFASLLLTEQRKDSESSFKSSDIDTFINIKYIIFSPILYFSITEHGKIFYQLSQVGYTSVKGNVNFGYAKDETLDNEKIKKGAYFYDPWKLNQEGNWGMEIRMDNVVIGTYATNTYFESGEYNFKFAKVTGYIGWVFGSW